MSGHETVNTHGRTRLSFASEADIDEFVVTLEKYERGEMTPDQWRAFRLVRGTYGQRQSYDASDAARQDPAGHHQQRAARALAEVGEQGTRADFGAHHDAPEHPVPLRQAARRRAGDAPAGRCRHDDARGVRQFGAQHHGVPVRRRRRERAVRRHALRRRRRPASCCATASARPCRASSRSPSRAAPTITRSSPSTIWPSRRSSARTASAASGCSPAAARR